MASLLMPCGLRRFGGPTWRRRHSRPGARGDRGVRLTARIRLGSLSDRNPSNRANAAAFDYSQYARKAVICNSRRRRGRSQVLGHARRQPEARSPRFLHGTRRRPPGGGSRALAHVVRNKGRGDIAQEVLRLFQSAHWVKVYPPLLYRRHRFFQAIGQACHPLRGQDLFRRRRLWCWTHRAKRDCHTMSASRRRPRPQVTPPMGFMEWNPQSRRARRLSWRVPGSRGSTPAPQRRARRSRHRAL